MGNHATLLWFFQRQKKNPSFPTPGPMKIAVGFFGAENHQLPRGGASAGKFDFPEKALRPDFATQEFDHRGLREVFEGLDHCMFLSSFLVGSGGEEPADIITS